MELEINDKCQLIVSGMWDVENFNSGTQDKIEVLVYWDDYTKYQIVTNRTTDSLVWDLPKDGWFQYFQINLNKNIDIDKNDPEALINHVNSSANSTDFKKKDIFSICKLRNCTIELEKESIHNFINHHKEYSCKKIKGQSTKDLLLIAVFVLENLIVKGKYLDATMIVESLSTCDTLCKSNKSQTCNCND